MSVFRVGGLFSSEYGISGSVQDLGLKFLDLRFT